MRSRLLSRVLFKHSQVYLPCHKDEVVLATDWGRIQLCRETYRPAGRRATDVYIVRFLGSRGRAELATLDPADRLPNVASEVWTMNPPGFGRTTGPPDLTRFASSARQVVSHARTLRAGSLW
ncbi:MAG TPA: hypothetical protein VGH98_08845 [Gemmatimonadaceae bacterium]|jgi:hypothetical protein